MQKMIAPRICPECQTSNPPQAAFCFGCGKSLGQVAVTPELLHQRYHLLHTLGTGGFGAVYQAEDMQLGKRLVAIKEMSLQSNLSAQQQAEATEAFRQEAFMLAELMHPNLPRIYDHFSEGGRWYLVMDYIEGITLEEYLAQTPGDWIASGDTLGSTQVWAAN
jgi:serine/threonine protein kinase